MRKDVTVVNVSNMYEGIVVVRLEFKDEPTTYKEIDSLSGVATTDLLEKYVDLIPERIKKIRNTVAFEIIAGKYNMTLPYVVYTDGMEMFSLVFDGTTLISAIIPTCPDHIKEDTNISLPPIMPVPETRSTITSISSDLYTVEIKRNYEVKIKNNVVRIKYKDEDVEREVINELSTTSPTTATLEKYQSLIPENTEDKEEDSVYNMYEYEVETKEGIIRLPYWVFSTKSGETSLLFNGFDVLSKCN